MHIWGKKKKKTGFVGFLKTVELFSAVELFSELLKLWIVNIFV